MNQKDEQVIDLNLSDKFFAEKNSLNLFTEKSAYCKKSSFLIIAAM